MTPADDDDANIPSREGRAAPAPPQSQSQSQSTSPQVEMIDDQVTGLPGLRTWGAVYLFVVAVFVLYVVLLAALSRAFA
ncbi:MAG TPA: hypothetical protein VER17_06325 [Tepidisphaeraceae bacterium]|nr:hypothetical protein [Tepidisphaeraceae bacterium]